MKKITFLTTILLLLLAACAPARPITITATPALTPTATTGIPVTASGVPSFDHIILIVLENRDYSAAMDGSSMPHIVDLAQKNVLLTDYFAASHPSLPNYLALMSGSTQGINTDCISCFVNAPNLADELDKAGKTWKAYLESMPSACFVGDSSPYAQKHNPLLYFNSIRQDSSVCTNGIVPLTQLDNDLNNNKLPNFSFIMPNLCDSGHDCTATTADDWVNTMVSKLQGSSALGKNYLIAVTFDEASDSDTSSCCGLGKGGGHVATILISPLAKPGFQDNTPYSHYSLLKTFLKAWNLPNLGKTSKPTVDPIVAPWIGSPALSGASGSSTSPTTSATQPAAESLTCSTSSPGGNNYTVKLCFSSPSNGTSLTGNVQISAKADVNGATSQVQRILYYLDGKYLLTSFYSPYSFMLPTADYPDGQHKLSVEAMMRDSSISDRAYVNVTFSNGVSATPADTSTFKPFTGTPAQSGAPFVVAATGDGAGGGQNPTNVTELLKSMNPNLFLYLGDVYERGSAAEFYNWYGTASTFFGQLKSITDPTIGNHEYGTTDGSAYFNYWGNIPNYYSFDAAGWHIVSLNSNVSKVPISVGSDQYNWLQQDLQKNTSPCTLVFYHEPLYNIGPEGTVPALADVWKLMVQYKVSIVLNGHDHDYQRWVPLDENGQPSPNGITEFVVGTGGHGLQNFVQSDPRVADKNNSNPAAFGALFLQLNSHGANFSYMSTDKSVLDSGVIPCVGSAADTTAPSNPTGLKATINLSSQVDLAWSAATDNTGVAGYAVLRNGNTIGTVPAYDLAYTDTNVSASLKYTYTVVAFDTAGKHSLASSPAVVTVPGVATSMAFTPTADTYTNATNPASNYGKSPFMRINLTPAMNGYMRFVVSGLGGKTVAHALLKIYVNNSNQQGFSVATVADNTWNEFSMNVNNAPSLGNVLNTSGPLTAASWVTIDVSSYIKGEGTYSFGLNTTGDKPVNLATREAGLDAPQLIVQFP